MGNVKDYFRNNWKEVLKGILFLILICAYAVSTLSHAFALVYGMLFVMVFMVLLYYHKVGTPAVRSLTFCLFYAWIGFDEKCYIFEDISNYSRFFYCMVTILIGIYLYYSGERKVNDNNGIRIWPAFVAEFLFWGYAILYKIEIGTVPIFETMVLAVAFLIWSAELINASLCLLNIAVAKMRKSVIVRQNYRRIWFTTFLILILGGGLFSFLFYPGVISPDTIDIYEAAMNLKDVTVRTDIHSFAYTFFERIIFSICDSFYFLTWILMTAFSAAWASIITNICRFGLNRKVAYAATFFWLLVPSSLYMLICTWKDMPFTVCLMVVVNMLMKMCAYWDGVQVKNRDYAFFTLGTIGVALLRSNGLFVLLVLCIVCMSYAIKRKNRATRFMLRSMVIAALAVLIIKIPVYRGLQVEGTPSGFAAIPFIDGIWENVVYGEEVPDKAVSFIENEIMPVDELEELYVESYTNTYSFPPDAWMGLEFGKARNAWLVCLKASPFVTVMARLKKTYNLWSVFPRGKIPTNINYVGGPDVRAGVSYISIPLFEKIRSVFVSCYSSGWLYGTFCYIIARGGWNIFLWIILGLFLKQRGLGECRIVIVPAMANTTALLIACCYQDYRYMYPMFVLTTLYMLYVLQVCAIQENISL